MPKMKRKLQFNCLAVLLSCAISTSSLRGRDQPPPASEDSPDESLPVAPSLVGASQDASQVPLMTNPAANAAVPVVTAAPTSSNEPAEPVTPAEENPTETPKPAAVPIESTAPTETPESTVVPTGAQNSNLSTPADATPVFGSTEMTGFTERGTSINSKWKVSPHFSVSAIFDDNVFLRTKNKKSDLIFTLSPGISLRLGSPGSRLNLLADYTVGVDIFTGGSSRDAFDQNAILDAEWHFDKLTVGTHFGFTSTTGGSLDVGDRVRRNVVYAGITSEYILDDKFSVELNADETWAGYKSLLDSNEIRAQLFLNYQLTPKLKLGIGGTYGHLSVDQGADQNYEQALVHAIYKPTEKLTFTGNVGGEFRQFSDNEGDLTNPVFSLGIVYNPFERTTITLDAHRRIYASAALVAQDYVATGFALSIRERLTQVLFATLSGGYENTNYRSTQTNVSATRNDDYFFLRPAIEYAVTDWFNIGVFYEFSRNFSSGEGARSFTKNRIGVVGTVFF